MIFLSRVLGIEAFGHLGVRVEPLLLLIERCFGHAMEVPSTRWRDYIPKLAGCIFISVILYLTDIIHESKTNSV